MTPYHLTDPSQGPAILHLLHRAFATMDGRINPPSSLHDLTEQRLFAQGEVWAIGTLPIACMILTPHPDHLYLGKLAIDPAHQGSGLARRLITLAEARARGLGLPRLELQTRVELVENHQIFVKFGFTETARNAHPGFAHPTSITFSKQIAPHV